MQVTQVCKSSTLFLVKEKNLLFALSNVLLLAMTCVKCQIRYIPVF